MLMKKKLTILNSIISLSILIWFFTDFMINKKTNAIFITFLILLVFINMIINKYLKV